MKIKVYAARTEQEAIEKIKNELGMDALILNIKKIQPRGLFSFFRRPSVEVTAAFDEKVTLKANPNIKMQPPPNVTKIAKNVNSNINFDSQKNVSGEASSDNIQKDDKDKALIEQQEKIFLLEEKLNNAQDLLDKVMSQLSISKQSNYSGIRKYENNMIQILYDSLVDQGVSERIAEALLEDASSIQIDDEKNDMSLIIKVVYNAIMNVFGEPDPIDIGNLQNGDPKIIVFMGPTGVGKTTTIAKLSSLFILNHNLRVGMITADTYRIAAVDQLKTYAEILGIDLGIVYSVEDLNLNIEKMRNNVDLILVDTAGRSHKNSENFAELEQILDKMPGCDRYLVLSTTTKYEDLLSIIGVYKDVTDFKLIFTKLDETTCFGTILNISYLTGKHISYMTYGQNVPEDIEVLQAEKITKSLLGLGGVKY